MESSHINPELNEAAAPANTSDSRRAKKQKKKKGILTEEAPSERSCDDDLLLSQFASHKQKVHAPITPKNKEADSLKSDVASHGLRRKAKRKLNPDTEVEGAIQTIAEEASATLATLPADPYTLYEPLIGQVCDVKLRMYRWWHGKLHGPRSIDSIVFLAVDEHGNTLQGSVAPYLAHSWNMVPTEGSLYLALGIQVVQPKERGQLVDMPIQFCVTQETRFEPLPDTEGHPLAKLKFTKLSTLPTLASMDFAIKDVLAVVIDIRPPVTRTSKAKLTTTKFGEAFLTDASIFPKCAGLTIWEEALPLFPQLTDEFAGPFVLQATTVKANKYGGNYCFQTTAFTRFNFLTEHIPQSVRLIKRLVRRKNQSDIEQLLHRPYSETLRDSSQGLHTIAAFRKAMQPDTGPSQITTYTIRAIVSHIYSELQTVYRSCTVCNTGMYDPQNDSNGCPAKECKNRLGHTTFKYRLTTTIKDDSARMDITLFNSPAEEILHTPATVIKDLLSEDGGLSTIQDIFRKAYNKTWDFSFQVTPGNYSYFHRGNYTLYQLEWIPRPFTNPETLLDHPSPGIPEPIIGTSSRQHHGKKGSPASPTSSKQTSTTDTTNAGSTSKSLARN